MPIFIKDFPTCLGVGRFWSFVEVFPLIFLPPQSPIVWCHPISYPPSSLSSCSLMHDLPSPGAPTIWIRRSPSLWYRPWYQFPHIKPSIYEVKTKTLILFLLSGFLAPESTILHGDRHHQGQAPGFIISSLQRDTGWWESCWPARSQAPPPLRKTPNKNPSF